MRDDTGKSVPVLRDFIVEILTPHTPEKPIIPNPQALSNQEQRQGSIIQYDAGFAHGANQAVGWTPLYKPPTRLSESASSSNSSIHHDRLFASTNNMMNGIDPMAHWHGVTLAPHTPEKPIVPNPQALSNQEQRQGSIIHYDAGLTHRANQAMRWTPLYRPPTRLSESASSGNSSIHQDRLFASTNNMMNGTNPMAHGRGMTFSDLLALNHGFASPTAFLSGNQESMRLLGGLDKRIEIQQNAANALPDAANALPDAVNAFPRGSAPVFAPATPGNAAPGKTFFSADRQPNRQPNKQNKVAAIDDLLGINGTQSATDPIPIERCDPDYKPDLDLNKTSHVSQPKPRRKKHRPKVVSEAKPKKTLTQRTPKPTDANETPRPKRTSVCKSKATTPPDSEAEALDFKIPARVVKSCRKALYFDLEDADVFMEETGEYSAYDVFVNNQTPPKDEFSAETEYESGRKMKNLTAISLQKENSTEAMEPRDFIESSAYYNTRSNSNRGKHKSGLKRANSDYMFLGNGIFSCTHYMYFPKIHKKRRTEKVLKPNISHMLSFTNALENIRFGAAKGSYPKGGHGIYFPEFRKKRRTQKVRKLNTSCALSFMHALENSRAGKRQNYRRETAKHSKYYSILVPHVNIGAEGNAQASTVPSHQDYTQITKWGDMEKLYKRFIAPMCIDDLDSQKGFKERKKKFAKGRDEGTWKKNLKTFDLSCMEAHPKVNNNKKDRRKSGKKNSAAKIVTSSFNMVYKHSLNSYRDQHFTRSSKGPFLALPWINTNATDIDDIIEGMQQLSINRECSIVQYQEENTLTPYHGQNQQANALVLYQRDDVMIPFERTQASKRRERAKVDLDDETNRVWNLLLEDINNQGIDGTDEEKTKWWEDERKVFRGRVDSFIARMRLVQGDRRFSPWKGSVVDSVVGVFLTQNVSDHLSSSAFMSLAARYPSKSENKATRDSEEEIGPSAKEQEICIVELDDNSENLTLSEKIVEGHMWDLNCRTIHNSDVSEEKVVNSEESQLCGASSIKESETSSATVDDRAIDDLSSSQHSVISQKSVESPSVPTSGEEPTNSSASFVELLKLAETPDATYTPIEQVSSCQSDLLDQEEILRYDNPSEKALRSENDSFSNVPIKCPAIYQLQTVKEYHVHSVNEESSSVNTTSSVENLTSDPYAAITESATEFHLQKKALKSNLVLSSSAVNVCSFYVLEGKDMVFQSRKQPIREQQDTITSLTEGSVSPQTNVMLPTVSTENSTVDDNLTPILPISDQNKSSNGEAHEVFKKDASKKKTLNKRKKVAYDWDSLRKKAQTNGSNSKQRTANTMDSIDWEAIRCADVNEIAETIRDRGMNNMLAERIKEFLDRVVNDHGSIDLEWLRDVAPDKAKEYLLSVRGLGLKSVECVRLLTLHHLAFPVDTNVGRIAVRLGWVPLQPLPESLQLHLLELYPVLESIQKYLWPRLCKLDQRTLYELHYHMITFGKVFCTKRQPNCNACPLRGECRHFASAFASARLALPGPQDKSIILSEQSNLTHQDPQVTVNPLPMPLLMADQSLEKRSDVRNCEPIVEIPASPEQESEQIQTLECDIEEAFSEDPNEIPTIRLNMEEFTHTLQAYMQSNKELEGDMSNALVALASEAASIPTPKLKNVNRLRTEHHVYELPDTHYLLRGLDRREPDDPCPYLLAIWSPGETANSRELPEKRCNFQEPGQLCSDETCFYCNSQREANSQTVRGTLLIPCRTAMKGSFPLNGTYFQVNEVFADQDSSLNPIQVPRALLWNLPRRTVYFGTSIPTIFKGLSTEGIQHCFWRGYVCVRGFDQKTRAPRPLMARLHFPASKSRARGRRSE